MNRKTLVFGIVLVSFGGLLLLRTNRIVIFGFQDFFEVAFPLGLIILGGWLIVRRHRQDQKQQTKMHFHGHTNVGGSESTVNSTPDPTPPPPGQQPYDPPPASAGQEQSKSDRGPSQPPPISKTPRYEEGRARYSGFLGDMFVDCQNIDMRNVEISAFIGDIEVKLHGADLGTGLSRMVVSGFIGDIRVLVPRGMAVFANGSSFVGDIEIFGRRSTGFGNNIDGQSEAYQTAESKLYIAINSFVGDIRVYEV